MNGIDPPAGLGVPSDNFAIPEHFVWSRSGVESGEELAAILSRKRWEQEYFGAFAWGIGSSIGKAFRALVDATPDPLVLFSPIVSRPRAIDAKPGLVALWTVAESARSGLRVDVKSFITSHGAASAHYALVCHSMTSVSASIDRTQLVNFSSRTRVGASQTTAVVSRASDLPSKTHDVTMAAVLTDVLTLREPIRFDASRVDELLQVYQSTGSLERVARAALT